MKRITIFYGALLTIFFTTITVNGQITDTISVNWEELPQPQKGIFTQYYTKTDTLFGIQSDPYEVWQSTDKGHSWALYRSDLLEFAATDSFIFYKKKYPLPAGGFQTRLERRNNTGNILGITPYDNSTFQYSNNGVSYLAVTATKMIPSTNETIFA